MASPAFGITRHLDRPFEEVDAGIREALRAQGFGVLTEIDVQATLREKLGVEFRRYVIIGACNPPLAHRALTADLAVGLLLPCNVIVYEDADRGGTTVSAFDPEAGMGLVQNDEVAAVARDAKARLTAAIEAI